MEAGPSAVIPPPGVSPACTRGGHVNKLQFAFLWLMGLSQELRRVQGKLGLLPSSGGDGKEPFPALEPASGAER